LRTKFFDPYSHFSLPKELQNPPPSNAEDSPGIIWGPFLGMLLSPGQFASEKANQWLIESVERVLYLESLKGHEQCVFIWWTDREHIFTLDSAPKVKNSVLKLRSNKDRVELWLRPFNN
jgi:hypothetical protein